MHKIYNKITQYLVGSVVLISLTACAGIETKKDQFTLQGCGAGAVSGALLAALRGGNIEKAALVGCAAGGIIGYTIGKRTDKYVSANQAINSEIARSHKNSIELHKYNTSLAKQVRIHQQEVLKIKGSKITSSDKQRKLRAKKKEVAQQLLKSKEAVNQVSNELRVAKNFYKNYSKSATPAKKNNWSKQIVSLEKQKTILSKNVKTLTALNSSI